MVYIGHSGILKSSLFNKQDIKDVAFLWPFIFWAFTDDR